MDNSKEVMAQVRKTLEKQKYDLTGEGVASPLRDHNDSIEQDIRDIHIMIDPRMQKFYKDFDKKETNNFFGEIYDTMEIDFADAVLLEQLVKQFIYGNDPAQLTDHTIDLRKRLKKYILSQKRDKDE